MKMIAGGVGVGAVIAMGALGVVLAEAPQPASTQIVSQDEEPTMTLPETTTSTTAQTEVETPVATPEVTAEPAPTP
ncbi:hypothetical protein SAMN04489835_3037 [Mycolicibacterium rutilum]|uniref:Uncharacterized protein n=2 Tax=Mycolicibacterium rutilum TaxID=370526 RepID=A0A1H6KAP8_MYCRU|nr:hypothetical protein SAMN04489835_3037 [Mycolicibacterium rutilum]